MHTREFAHIPPAQPYGGGAADLPTLRSMPAVVSAQHSTHFDALGGLGSPGGSCVWHVVGVQGSIRERAMRQGWVVGQCAWNRRRESW